MVGTEVGKLVVLGLLEVFEACEFVEPRELDVADGAVALLANQEVGLAFQTFAVFFIVLVELFAMDIELCP